MKKALLRIGLFAFVSAMALGCANKDNSEPQPEGFKRTVQVTFTKEADTKTAIVEGTDKATYVWTEGDQQYFKVWENTALGTVEGIVYSADMKTATLSMAFNTATASEYVYKARFANVFSNHGNMQIKETQSPSAASYDPSADVMYADNISSSTAMTSLQFVLHRAITVNKMTLKGMTVGEKVSRVEITFNDKVTGYFDPDNNSYSLSGNKIVLTYNNLEVGSDGNFPVYFISAPVQGIALSSVVVYTDQNSYNRTSFSKTYNFAIGTMVRFGINMAGTATPINTSETYTLVNSASDLTAGDYIIAAPSSTNKAMGHLSGSIHTAEVVTKDGNSITLDNTSSVLPLILAKSGDYWTIKNNDPNDTNYGNYIAWNSGNSSTETETPYTWTISVSSGIATIRSVNTTSRYLQYNSSSPRFCCYESSSNQQNVALYKKTGGALPVGISFANESYTFTRGSSEYNSFTGQEVTKDASDSREVTYSMTGAFIGTINSSDGTIELNGEIGTVTVMASVGADATHSAGSVTYTITVNPPIVEYDLLDYGFIGVTTTTYSAKTGLQGSSGRGSVYYTFTAGGTNDSGPTIQVRTKNSNEGIVTTSSGGKILKIELVWNSYTSNDRTVEIYGKHTAYASPSDLYSSSTRGSLIGEMAKGTTTLTVSDDYEYLGIKSKDGALYLDEIHVYWTNGSPSTDPFINVTSANPVTVAKTGGSKTITYSIVNPVSGVSLTASSNVPWITDIAYGSSTVTFNVAAQAAGAASRSGVITLNYNGASPAYVTVSQEAGEGGSQAANGWLELPAQQTGTGIYNGTMDTLGKRNYSYMYDSEKYTCLWVAYPLYPSAISSSEMSGALGPYYPDVYSDETRASWYFNWKIPTSLQVNVCKSSYGVGDYSRGHQIANADRAGNSAMQKQTYYVTNSTPQIQNGFNGGIWNNLETAVRNVVNTSADTLYVVTGAAFKKGNVSESITYINPSPDPSKNVPVPNYYWKVVLKVKRSGGSITSAKAIGFWLPHQGLSGHTYTEYVYSVNQIEEWTGFNFFVNLPADLQAAAKSNTSCWNTSTYEF